MIKSIFCAAAVLVMASAGMAQADFPNMFPGPSQPCKNIAGQWDIKEDATVTCNGDTQRGHSSGSISIVQSGCSITFRDQNNAQRNGTVADKNIKYSGKASMGQSNITLTKNEAFYEGTYDQFFDKIIVKGTVVTEGKLSDGKEIKCKGTTNATLRKALW